VKAALTAVLAASVLGIGCSIGPGVTPDPSAQLQGRIDRLVEDRGGTAEVYREILTEASCDRLFQKTENYASLRDDPATSSEKIAVFDSYSSLAGQRWIELGC
jgi:hypothetical protein